MFRHQQYYVQAKPILSIRDRIPSVSVNDLLHKDQSKIQQFNELISNTYPLQQLMPLKPRVLSTIADKNDSARAIVCGVLIAASIAIKNNTLNKPQLLESLTILYDATLILKNLYQQGWEKLVIQSKAFPKTCNAILDLIQKIRANRIETTELVILARKNHRGADHSINLAMTDISHYLLYLAAMDFVTTHFENMNVSEEVKVRAIRDDESAIATEMTDLLHTGVVYTDFQRALVCQRLNIKTYNIAIDNHYNTSLKEEGVESDYASFVTFTEKGHTSLLLDQAIMQQIQMECRSTPFIQFRDIEERVIDKIHSSLISGVEFYPTVGIEDTLHAMDLSFNELCHDAANHLNTPDFNDKLSQLSHLFFEHIRPLSWSLHQKDRLFELEKMLYSWHEKTSFNNNKQSINQLLTHIYKSEIEPLLLESSQIQMSFCIGGMDNQNKKGWVDLDAIIVNPRDYQQLTVLIEGINRTIVHARLPNFKQQLSTSLVYLTHLVEHHLITPPDKNTIKQAMFEFYQAELDAMPQFNIPPGFPGYEASLLELANQSKILGRFNRALNRIHIEGEPDILNQLTMTIIDTSFSFNEPLSWPNTIDEFEKSIQLNEACKEAWEERFRQNEKNNISDAAYYFTQMRDLMDMTSDSVRTRLTAQLKLFADQLAKRGNFFEIHMMHDIAIQSSSPKMTHSLYHDAPCRFELKHIPSVDHPIARHDLPSIIPKDTKTLHIEHLIGKLKQLFHQAPTNNFDHFFMLFDEAIKQFFHEYKTDADDLFIAIIQMKPHLPLYLIGSNFHKLDSYLEQIERRYITPLSTDMDRELQNLKQRYARVWQNNRRSLKYSFLETLENHIKNNPVSTYKECIDEVMSMPRYHDKLFMKDTLSHRFWGTNGLEHYLERLKTTEPFHYVNAQSAELISMDYT